MRRVTATWLMPLWCWWITRSDHSSVIGAGTGERGGCYAVIVPDVLARCKCANVLGIKFAQLVDDPSSFPNRFPSEEEQRTERERLTADRHDVLEPLDEEAVRAAARALAASGVEAIAVCFLFSYLNPSHERRAAAIVREEAPGLFVTASADVAPQFREFERFTTAAMNAFIGPKVRRYVARLDEELTARGLDADLRIMRSNGGLATASLIAELPVLTLLSGPAAGVLGAYGRESQACCQISSENGWPVNWWSNQARQRAA